MDKLWDIMIPFREVAVLDRNSKYRGVPPKQLMENAGKALAEEIKDRYPGRPVLFICGTGNNGGDGYVAARYLSGWSKPEDITVFLIKGRESVRSKIAKDNLKRLECRVVEELSMNPEHVIIDGLLGTGIKGTIKEPYRSVIEKINASDQPIISVDVPSGLGADIHVTPEATVTFHDMKEGMNAKDCGEIVVKDIGIPQEAQRYTGPGELLLYPTPEPDSHKGENGTLLIIGGGPYTGAPALAALAAYRTGADLVHLAVPSNISSIVAGYSPSFIVHPLKGDQLELSHLDKISDISKDCSAVLIGPGLGASQITIKAVKELIDSIELPMVIDADALKALQKPRFKAETVLTPHHGEFASLTDSSVERYAASTGATVLLKGKEDIITDGSRKKINDFGTPAMTVGGTGDTLAGTVGALLAKGLSSFDAARLGAYITTRAGEIAFEKISWGLMPEDVSENIPSVLKELEK